MISNYSLVRSPLTVGKPCCPPSPVLASTAQPHLIFRWWGLNRKKGAAEHWLSKCGPAVLTPAKKLWEMQIPEPIPDPLYLTLLGWGWTIWVLLSTAGDSDDTRVWEALLKGTENIPLACFPWWWLSEGLNLTSGSSSCFKAFRWLESNCGWTDTPAPEEVTQAFPSRAHYAQSRALPGEAAILRESSCRKFTLGFHGYPGVGKNPYL